MQAHPITTSLPTFNKLGVQPPKDVDAEKVGRAWTDKFAQLVAAKDIQGIVATIQPDGWWRDIFALTWDLRTFQGPEKITQFLEDRRGCSSPATAIAAAPTNGRGTREEHRRRRPTAPTTNRRQPTARGTVSSRA